MKAAHLPPVEGVLLAGGRSRRFGSDKRFAEYRGRTLFEWGLLRLRGAVGGRLFVAAGARRAELSVDASFLSDARADSGPLGGIVAALARARFGVLALACDTPAVSTELLLQVARSGRATDRIAAPHRRGRYEPLAAYYPVSALPRLAAQLREGPLDLQRALTAAGAIAVRGFDGRRLHNVNRVSDL